MTATTAEAFVTGLDGLGALLDVCADGRTVYGPVERDGAIVVRPITSIDDLPVGVGTDYAPGRARLAHGGGRDRFGWAVGAQAWKPLLHPAAVTTLEFDQAERTVPVTVRRAPESSEPAGAVLFGVRPCDLAAILTLDRVLVDTPPAPEPVYLRRRDVVIVVVDCGEPAATCFCTSTGTGPHAGDTGYDLRVTELTDADGPDYVVRAGSDAGRALLERIDASEVRACTDRDRERVEATRRGAEASMVRSLDADALRSSLLDELTDPAPDGLAAWADVAERCVACGNCTAVCPTCFCTSIDDVGDLSGSHVERIRRWSSCFELEYSRVGDAPIRSTTAARYRQWYLHKFATWVEQFGTSGCVGCGRCIAWCPVGIDVTSEAAHRVAAARLDGADAGRAGADGGAS